MNTSSLMNRCVFFHSPQLYGDHTEVAAGEQTNKTAIVDPYTPSKLEDAAKKENVKIGEFLLTTHGHHDHAGYV